MMKLMKNNRKESKGMKTNPINEKNERVKGMEMNEKE